MITESPKREVIVNYPLAKVKHALFESARLIEYKLSSKNDLLNFYEVTVVKGLRTGLIRIAFKEISNEKTDCKFEIINLTGGTASPALLSSFQDEYLQLFADLLAGKKKIVAPVPLTKKEAKSQIVFYAIGTAIFLAIIIWKLVAR
jgi:hypothetical protein